MLNSLEYQLHTSCVYELGWFGFLLTVMTKRHRYSAGKPPISRVFTCGAGRGELFTCSSHLARDRPSDAVTGRACRYLAVSVRTTSHQCLHPRSVNTNIHQCLAWLPPRVVARAVLKRMSRLPYISSGQFAPISSKLCTVILHSSDRHTE